LKSAIKSVVGAAAIPLAASVVKHLRTPANSPAPKRHVSIPLSSDLRLVAGRKGHLTMSTRNSKPKSTKKIARRAIGNLTSALSTLKQSGGPKRTRRSNAGGAGKGALQTRSSGTGRLGLTMGVHGVTTKHAQVIEEDEYIAEVNGSVAFVCTAYAINPGNTVTFPWANGIAKLYERYKYDYIEFYFKREVSEYATNGTTGKVMLSCDYDASDPPPTTKRVVEDTIPHNDGMPSDPFIGLRLDVSELNAMGKGRYVLTGAQPVGTDIKTYNAGNLFVSTQGCVNTNVIGELRVRYRCRLFVPQISPAISGLNYGNTASFICIDAMQTNTVTQFVGVTAAPVILYNNISGMTISPLIGTATAGYQFNLPTGPDTYLVEGWCNFYSQTGSVTSITGYSYAGAYNFVPVAGTTRYDNAFDSVTSQAAYSAGSAYAVANASVTSIMSGSVIQNSTGTAFSFTIGWTTNSSTAAVVKTFIRVTSIY